MKKIIAVAFTIVTLVAIWNIKELKSVCEMGYSMVSEDLLGKLLPYQHKIVSSFQNDDLHLEIVCHRNFLTYSITLYSKVSGQSIEPIMLATKDSVQDCNEYIIENVEWEERENDYQLTFRNDSTISIDAP